MAIAIHENSHVNGNRNGDDDSDCGIDNGCKV